LNFIILILIFKLIRSSEQNDQENGILVRDFKIIILEIKVWGLQIMEPYICAPGLFINIELIKRSEGIPVRSMFFSSLWLLLRPEKCHQTVHSCHFKKFHISCQKGNKDHEPEGESLPKAFGEKSCSPKHPTRDSSQPPIKI